MKIVTNGIEHEHNDAGAHEAALHGFARSPHFETEERHARNEDSRCVVTGVQTFTQWHHCLVPFHVARFFGRWELEFSRRNLLFLLQKSRAEYHRVLGHLLFFQSYNPNLMADIQRFKRWSIDAIHNDPEFVKACNSRPKSLRDMTAKEQVTLKAYIAKVLPVDPTELKLYEKYKPAK